MQSNSWVDDLWDKIPKDLKRLSWLAGFILLMLFTVGFFVLEPGTSKEAFVQDVIILLIGYVVGHPIGALLKSGE